MSQPYDPDRNPYKARRLWPPDFSTMSAKEQFRLEKTYRRRAKLAYTRPGWQKGTKILQWGAIGAVVVYSIFFMDWPGKKESPVQSIREWMDMKKESIWTSPSAPNLGRISEQSRKAP